MPMNTNASRDPWPPLTYEEFAVSGHLLHMGMQAIGKLKLAEPFQPQWAQVPMWVCARGLTTGPIPYRGGAYEVTTDLIRHRVVCTSSWGFSDEFAWEPMSVAGFVERLFGLLHGAGIEVSINHKPQEVANPIPFDQDGERRGYEPDVVNRWWRILLSTQRVMQVFHGRFLGKTQPIGVMWGTMDIRDVRYRGNAASPGEGADRIRRNAMNEEQSEVGWWPGSVAYPKPAFFAFTYPSPEGVEAAQVKPATARWDARMGEFLYDYADLRTAQDPDGDLLAFFESTYQAGAERAGWDPKLVGSGRPE